LFAGHTAGVEALICFSHGVFLLFYGFLSASQRESQHPRVDRVSGTDIKISREKMSQEQSVGK
jgi:hypothetical protein